MNRSFSICTVTLLLLMALSEKSSRDNLLSATYLTIANKIELSAADILSNTSLRVIAGLCEKLHCSPEILCDVFEALICGLSKNINVEYDRIGTLPAVILMDSRFVSFHLELAKLLLLNLVCQFSKW